MAQARRVREPVQNLRDADFRTPRLLHAKFPSRKRFFNPGLDRVRLYDFVNVRRRHNVRVIVRLLQRPRVHLPHNLLLHVLDHFVVVRPEQVVDQNARRVESTPRTRLFNYESKLF